MAQVYPWESRNGRVAGERRTDSVLAPWAARKLKVTAAVIRRHHSTLVVPLVMLCMMLAVGLWGVFWGTDSYEKQQRQQAKGFAEAYMRDYHRRVAEITSPLIALNIDIRRDPTSWARLNVSLAEMMPDVLRMGGLTTNYVETLFIAPQGHVKSQYLSSPFEPDTDLFSHKYSLRIASLDAVQARGARLVGPIFLDNNFTTTTDASSISAEARARINAAPNTVLVMYLMPVFVSAAPGSTQVLPHDVAPATDCAACKQAVNGEVFWGFLGVSRRIDEWTKDDNVDGGPLTPYRFKLMAADRAQLQTTADSVVQGSGPTAATILVGRSTADVKDPVSVSVIMDTTNATWVLHVSPKGGTWTPAWYAPMIATVIIVSFVLATSQFIALLAWRQHGLLLESLLPQHVLQQLEKQHDYGSHITDTEMVASGTPAETMLRVLANTLHGKPPDLRDTVLVRTTLMRGADVYRPLDLTAKIKAASGLDSDVARELARQLDSSYQGEQHGSLGSSRRLSILEVTHSDFANMDLEKQSSLRAAIAAIAFPGSTAGNGNVTTGCWSKDGTFDPDLQGLGMSWASARSSSCEPDTSAAVRVSHDTVMNKSRLGPEDNYKLAAPAPAAPAAAAAESTIHLVAAAGGGSGLAALSMLNGAAMCQGRSSTSLRNMQKVGQEGSVHSVPRLLMEELDRQLATVNEWSFDAMALAAASNGRPLSTLGFYVLSSTGLMDKFKLKGSVVARYLTRLESLYISNPYHNATHAADVLHTMHVLVLRGGLAGFYAEPLGQLACYIAAIVHDVGHLGRTNDFLCATAHDLAVRYNDKAPLENHHASQAFDLLRQPGLDFLTPLKREQHSTLRRMVIDLVLATDMKQHFSVVSQFKTLHAALDSDADRKGGDHGGNQQSPLTQSAEGGPSPEGRQGSNFIPNIDEAGKLLTLQLALKCADLGHLSSPLPVHLRWVAALEEEYFRQGDAEKAARLPVSPLFDRNKPGITKSQVGFFNIVVLPLFHALAAALPGTRPLSEAVNANCRYWQECEAKEKEEKRAGGARGRGDEYSITVKEAGP